MNLMKKAIRMIATVIICTVFVGQTMNARRYDDDDYDDRNSEAGTIVGTTATGALVGGLAGGGKGAGIGAAAGLGLGLISTSGSRHNRHERRRKESREDRAYNHGWNDTMDGVRRHRNYSKGYEENAYEQGMADARRAMNMRYRPIPDRSAY